MEAIMKALSCCNAGYGILREMQSIYYEGFYWRTGGTATWTRQPGTTISPTLIRADEAIGASADVGRNAGIRSF